MSAKFLINDQHLIEFTNQFWDVKIAVPSSNLRDTIARERKMSSSSLGSAPGTPRVRSDDGADADAPQNKMQKVSNADTGRVAALPKTNTCVHIYSTGKDKGNKCGAPCAGLYCTRHNKSKAAKETVVNGSEAPVVAAAPVDQHVSGVDSNDASSPALMSPADVRKLVRKVPAKLVSEELIKKRVEKIKLTRNLFGNYEIQDTNFVYNINTQKVVGKQRKDGLIEPLDAEDINKCKQLKRCF